MSRSVCAGQTCHAQPLFLPPVLSPVCLLRACVSRYLHGSTLATTVDSSSLSGVTHEETVSHLLPARITGRSSHSRDPYGGQTTDELSGIDDRRCSAAAVPGRLPISQHLGAETHRPRGDVSARYCWTCAHVLLRLNCGWTDDGRGSTGLCGGSGDSHTGCGALPTPCCAGMLPEYGQKQGCWELD